MAYNIKTEVFEGPFNLLLHLVSNRKVDIGAISINEIADQYLEEVSKMGTLDLDIASDFLLVAATLLEMKAQALLPQQKGELEEEIQELTPSQAYTELAERLITYKQFKNASEELYGRYLKEGELHTRPFGAPSEFLNLMPDFLKGVEIDDMGRIAAGVLAKRKTFLLESEHIAAKPIAVEAHVEMIYNKLKDDKHLTFSEIVSDSDRLEVVVVSFLAILELYKRSLVKLAQKSEFGDIDIDFIEDVPEPTFGFKDEEYE